MVICGSSMFEFSVSKDMKDLINNDKRIPTCLLLLILIVKELKGTVEQGRVVTTLTIILNIIFSVGAYLSFFQCIHLTP
jgi:hypothetical protein